ncbi:MAG: hypothetical protein ACREBF_00025 [Candidatus Micrarchaeales archaeon]
MYGDKNHQKAIELSKDLEKVFGIKVVIETGSRYEQKIEALSGIIRG